MTAQRVTPTLGALRAARGMPPIEPTPNLDAAIRCGEAAWQHFLHAASHLVVARRVTCGCRAAISASETLTSWINGMDFDALDTLADDLVAEAEKHARTA